MGFLFYSVSPSLSSSICLFVVSVCLEKIEESVQCVCLSGRQKFFIPKSYPYLWVLLMIICSFRDLSYNNLSGPVPKFPARTFKYSLSLYININISIYIVNYHIFPDFAFCSLIVFI